MDFLYYFNILILLFLLHLSLKYFKSILIKKNNKKFYNSIVRNKIVYILTTQNCNDITKIFIEESSKYEFTGFDCEWAPDKNISLIQISFPNGITFLIRLLETKEHIPSEILDWMKDKRKLKFGVGVLEDGRKLESQWGIDLYGSIDLRHLAVRLRSNGLTKMGLKSLASCWLYIDYPYEEDVSRLKSVQCSNWEANELSYEQIEYASLDSIVGALCPIEFLCRKLSQSPIDVMSNLNKLRSYCHGCIDLKFKSKMKEDIKHTNGLKKINNKTLEKMFCRASPIYDNASLITPDGEMLSRLSKKKAEWYIRRHLGVQISEDPFVVKLLFEPSGRASGENDYYIQEKENICVVCGSNRNCVRKNVVPIEYRRHYPVSHKSHKSHDVLPLCVDCHRHGNIIDDYKKKELAELYGAPLGPKELIDTNKSRIKNAARALKYKENIPLTRINELRSIVASYYGLESLDDHLDILDEASELEIGNVDGKFVPHGEVVVSTLKTATDLVNFEVMWREHFIEKLQPKYLPIGWSVNHRSERYILLDRE